MENKLVVARGRDDEGKEGMYDYKGVAQRFL